MVRTGTEKTPQYLVICGSLEPYVVEREVKDCNWDRTVNQIGEMQFEGLRSVIEIGTGRDVTSAIVAAAAEKRAHEDADYSHSFYELVELCIGTRAARSFLRCAS